MKPQEQHTDEQNDPSWDLLKYASQQEAGPMFSRDVLRAVRLSEEVKTPWWKSLLQAKAVLVSGALAVCALLFVPLMMDSTPQGHTPSGAVVQQPTEAIEQEVALSEADLLIEDDDLASEFIIALAESPEVFANEETFELIGL